MDRRLVTWARAVKARRRLRFPVLWLFTDASRLPDPLPAIAGLPPGLCGVVFRHDALKGRAGLAEAVAALCRQRRVALSVAGDWRLAARLGAGVHLRAGRGLAGHGGKRRGRFRTASAHGAAQLVSAWRAEAVAFLSPAFSTRSHVGSPALGAVRWARLARGARGPVLPLGGVDGASIRRLGRAAGWGVGAIGALGAHGAAS